jgi:rhodanese-related sulfurtransferase
MDSRGCFVASVTFEILDGSFVFFGGTAGLERPEVSAPAGPWVFLARIQSVTPGFEFPDHGQNLFAGRESSNERSAIRNDAKARAPLAGWSRHWKNPKARTEHRPIVRAAFPSEVGMKPNRKVIMTTATIHKTDPARAKEYFEDKMTFTTGPVELERELKNDEVNIIDVRAADDYRKGHIPGAKSLPKDRWTTFEGLDRDKVNVLYCYSQVCHLAATAAVEFAGNGYSVMELEGGFAGWQKHDLPIEK